MGYDLERFVTSVDEEFICSICTGVLENGVQLQHCEHMFCDQCIKDWISVNSICPVDRKQITLMEFKPISRAFNNLLSKLEIRCDFERQGCKATVKLETLHNHLNACIYNPNIERTCDKSCGLKITSSEYRNHDCVKKLAQLLLEQQKEIIEFKKEFRALVRTQNWQNGTNTINENNIITFVKPNTVSPHPREPDIDMSHSLYPITTINNYFEVKILELGINRIITVGLTRKDYPSDRHPGWENGSIAYHGDDGRIYIENGYGHPFGPIWVNGDVIGCGIKFPKHYDTHTREPVIVYFKRNNMLIGSRPVRIPIGGFFPSISLRSIGARVQVNLV